MKARSGFTLLELIVSIAVTGIIALLVYGSANAGFDTRDALARHREGAESELRARAFLVDALRHASEDANPGDAAFELRDAADSRGLPADQLTFLSRGVIPPLGASALWVVTVAPSPAGLMISAGPAPAAPTDSAGVTSVVGVIAGARGVDVDVMSLADRRWTNAWPSNGQLPAAARVILYDATGRPMGAPVVARIGLESMR
ncbi:MAG TPA: prepilin-type N-terminal cleavage/methylation domain-containing protein [Gemmatimonadaceae bacterium]|nr:prepilin-type N-terminal cleavage/methylation domain-containing protein [Gemmatimonadaceae bacterium]